MEAKIRRGVKAEGTEEEFIAVLVETLKGIEALDSDGDGYSNIEEIKVRTLPGDRSDHPAGQ